VVIWLGCTPAQKIGVDKWVDSQSDSLTNTSLTIMPDVIEDVHNLYYVQNYQPELEKLDQEEHDLNRARYKGTSSLGPLEHRIRTEILGEGKSPDSGYCLDEYVVVCHGPFRHGVGLVGDTVQILIAHTASTLTKGEVLLGLHRCKELCQVRSCKGQYNCSVDVLYSDLVTGKYEIERWFQKGFTRTLERYIQIVSLPEISWDELLFSMTTLVR
jgi:hypothetical protein